VTTHAPVTAQCTGCRITTVQPVLGQFGWVVVLTDGAGTALASLTAADEAEAAAVASLAAQAHGAEVRR